MKNYRKYVYVGLLALSLSSCDWLKETPSSYGGWSSDRPMGYQQQAEPELRVMKAADATWIEPAAPAYNAVPMETRSEKAVLQQQASNEQMRLQQLEHNVTKMQDDLDMIVPALQKIVSHQQQQQAQMAQQQQQAQMQAQMAQQQPYMTPHASSHPASLTPQAYTPQAQPSVQPIAQPVMPASMVKSVRFGEHADKTRIVFDSTAPIAYKYTLNAMQNELVIRMPNTDWATQAQQVMRASNAVNGYSVRQNSEGGVDVVVGLKRQVRVQTELLSPQTAGSQGGYRIFFDLMPI